MDLSQAPTFAPREVLVDGRPVRYVDGGSGPVVVLLHGWGGEVASFAPVLPRLAARFRVVALDLPGHGGTPVPPQPWGAVDYGDFVAAFLRALALPPATVVGHSHGGRTGVALAARHPTLVQKLVLVDSAGLVPPRGPGYYLRVCSVKGARRVLALPGLRRWRQSALQRLYQAVGSRDYQAATDPVLRATFVRLVNEDIRSLLPQIVCPTLLIWGGADAETPLRDGQVMERLIPDAGLVVFDGAGHFAYLDRLEQFCRVVTHFVEH
jgi:pimeloyl-ACP methyl ester carboxylesterase